MLPLPPPEGAPVLVNAKLAEAETPATLAVTVKLPVWLFAVGTGDVATPLLLVVAVALLDPPNVALAPLPGALNVTVAPLTRLPLPSFAVAWSNVPNAVFTAALCGVPPVAVILAGAPIVLVNAKLAEVETP